MVNNEVFAKRIKKIILFYGISAAQLADKIGVQRSSISHLLSGRNKPSLDFIMKLLHSYPEIELHWLLNGKGTFPVQQEKQKNILENTPQTALKENKDKSIDRIVIFYKDGSFKNYES